MKMKNAELICAVSVPKNGEMKSSCKSVCI